MKKIKTINKLLSSLTLLSPLSGIGFNSQYQSTQKVITEDFKNSLNSFTSSNAETKMGDIYVNLDETGKIIQSYASGTGSLVIPDYVTQIANDAFQLTFAYFIITAVIDFNHLPLANRRTVDDFPVIRCHDSLLDVIGQPEPSARIAIVSSVDHVPRNLDVPLVSVIGEAAGFVAQHDGDLNGWDAEQLRQK